MCSTSPYHLQSNAKVEKFHKTLGDVLTKLARDDTKTWDLYLIQALAAVRFTINETSRFSPHYMLSFWNKFIGVLSVHWYYYSFHELNILKQCSLKEDNLYLSLFFLLVNVMSELRQVNASLGLQGCLFSIQFCWKNIFWFPEWFHHSIIFGVWITFTLPWQQGWNEISWHWPLSDVFVNVQFRDSESEMKINEGKEEHKRMDERADDIFDKNRRITNEITYK